MSDTLTAFFIIAIILLLATAKYIHTKKSTALKELLHQAGSERVILLQLNIKCFGIDSHDGGFMYRSGHLMLTDRHLIYFMWLPKWSLTIPLERILRAEKQALGEGIYRKLLTFDHADLLKVEYISAQRTVESVTWIMKDTDHWIDELGV